MPELQGPDMPPEAERVWRWFVRLNSTRPSGMGVSGIPETEMAAFFRTRRLSPMQWEIEAITALDAIYLANSAESAQSTKEAQKAE